MAAWSIKLINMLRLYIYTQTQEKDTWSMSNVCYSTWHNWLSLVTFCMGFSQHLCRNFWTCSPFIKKVPRLTSEGKYAEAGVPSQWQLLSFLKHSWKKKKAIWYLQNSLSTSFWSYQTLFRKFTTWSFCKNTPVHTSFLFPLPHTPTSLRPQCNWYMLDKEENLGSRVEGSNSISGMQFSKVNSSNAVLHAVAAAVCELFLKHLNSDLGIREVCPETHSVNIWAPVTKHEPSARIQWGKRLNQRLPHRACSLMEAIWNSGQVI